MQKKSILLVVNTLFAGAGKILLFVANVCAKAGWKVTVATLYDADISNYHIEGVNFVNFNIPTRSKIWRIHALKIIRNNVRTIQPDVLCAFVSDVVFMTRLATLGIKTFFISAERGDPYTLPKKWIRFVKWAYRNGDFSVFQLKGAQDFFDEKIKRNSTVIPNPYSTGKKIVQYSKERKKTIVSVGRFVEQKGYDVLINAFKIFQKKHQDYKLIIYGNGPLKDELTKMSCALGLSESISFPGFINNVTSAIHQDGIFVLSSRFEGIPNSLIEAMSVGVPTISTDCSPGGPRFLTDNGRRGILVPVDDVLAMAKAMDILADNYQKAQDYSNLGLEIIDELDPEKIADKWINVFEKAYKKISKDCSL